MNETHVNLDLKMTHSQENEVKPLLEGQWLLYDEEDSLSVAILTL